AEGPTPPLYKLSSCGRLAIRQKRREHLLRAEQIRLASISLPPSLVINLALVRKESKLCFARSLRSVSLSFCSIRGGEPESYTVVSLSLLGWFLEGSGSRRQEAMSSKGKEVVHSSGGQCAACAILRRTCEPDCVFAPHFPAEDDPARFLSVHAAFGSRNVEHFLRCARSEQLRADAARYLVLNAPRLMAVPPGPGAGGTQQPPHPPQCAACLHIGDACGPECVFARHFPAGDDPARFAAVDARFGAHEVALFLCALSPEQQDAAVRNFVILALDLPPRPPPEPEPEGSRPPCAACRHLRRTCVTNCLFAPIFPPDDDSGRFAAVHSAYGSSNLNRRLRYLPPELRGLAAATSAYEARRRQENPVLGVVEDVQMLETLLRMTRRQVADTREQLVPFVGREAAFRSLVPPRPQRQTVPAPHMRQMEAGMQGVAEMVRRQAAADAAAGVTTFVTPLHEKLVKTITGDIPGSSTAAVQGPPPPAQPVADAAAQDPGLQDGEEEDAGDDGDKPSQAQDPGLPEGEEDAGDDANEPSQGIN
ncbi:hypothetical protein EJB05_02465, partial [Eragrostis curvula]